MSITITDLRVVYRETYNARAEWENILLELGVDKPTIDSIKLRCRDNPKDCYREGLSYWLTGGLRNWRDVVDALTSPIVDHNRLARIIDEKFIQVHQPSVQENTITQEGIILFCH